MDCLSFKKEVLETRLKAKYTDDYYENQKIHNDAGMLIRYCFATQDVTWYALEKVNCLGEYSQINSKINAVFKKTYFNLDATNRDELTAIGVEVANKIFQYFLEWKESIESDFYDLQLEIPCNPNDVLDELLFAHYKPDYGKMILGWKCYYFLHVARLMKLVRNSLSTKIEKKFYEQLTAAGSEVREFVEVCDSVDYSLEEFKCCNLAETLIPELLDIIYTYLVPVITSWEEVKGKILNLTLLKK